MQRTIYLRDWTSLGAPSLKHIVQCTTVGGQYFASKPEGRLERERHDCHVSARGQPLLPNNVHDWMKARGYLQLAKFCPIGIYLKDLQTAPNSRLWMLRLIRELGSDLQNFVSSALI